MTLPRYPNRVPSEQLRVRRLIEALPMTDGEEQLLLPVRVLHPHLARLHGGEEESMPGIRSPEGSS